MIIDLNLKGQQVILVGGGREASRKVEALLSQDCEIIVVAETICDAIKKAAESGQIQWVSKQVKDGKFLSDYPRLRLVLAVTDDRLVNRKIVEAAKQLRSYAYSADDPENSDFSHPATINLYDTVQVAISTGGQSPLMARMIREKAETLFAELITEKEVQQIRLQAKLRTKSQEVLSTPDARKKFLSMILQEPSINQLLEHGENDEAYSQALIMLQKYANKQG
jgi:precorrin-2 dehydrogenase/sirohydrochlorin ferrochelatase